MNSGGVERHFSAQNSSTEPILACGDGVSCAAHIASAGDDDVVGGTAVLAGRAHHGLDGGSRISGQGERLRTVVDYDKALLVSESKRKVRVKRNVKRFMVRKRGKQLYWKIPKVILIKKCYMNILKYICCKIPAVDTPELSYTYGLIQDRFYFHLNQ